MCGKFWSMFCFNCTNKNKEVNLFLIEENKSNYNNNNNNNNLNNFHNNNNNNNNNLNKNTTLNNKNNKNNNKEEEEEEWEGILYLGIVREKKKLIEYFDQNFYSKNNLNEQNEIKQSLEKIISLIDCSIYQKRIFDINSNWFLFYFI